VRSPVRFIVGPARQLCGAYLSGGPLHQLYGTRLLDRWWDRAISFMGSTQVGVGTRLLGQLMGTRLSGCWWDWLIWWDLVVRSVDGTWDVGPARQPCAVACQVYCGTGPLASWGPPVRWTAPSALWDPPLRSVVGPGCQLHGIYPGRWWDLTVRSTDGDPPIRFIGPTYGTRLSGCWWDWLIWWDLAVRSVDGTWDVAVRSLNLLI
jgi:hypothetical protein